MDDGAKSREKEKDKDKADVETSLASITLETGKEKDGKPVGRARTRSIWGRKKEKPVAV